MSDLPQKSPSKRIPGLDGLRGCAALIVLLSHLSNKKMHVIPGLDMGGTGKAGVYLFFTLSAFVLTIQILSWSSSRFFHWKSWANYFFGRFFRIFPLFTIVVLFSYFTTTFKFPLSDRGIPFNIPQEQLFKTFTLGDASNELWTIPVEFKFYFMLPFIALFLVVALKRNYLLGSVIMLAIANLGMSIVRPGTGGTVPWSFTNIFFTGIAIALIHHQTTTKNIQLAKNQQIICEYLAWIGAIGFIFTIPAVVDIFSNGTISRRQIQLAHHIFSTIWSLTILGMLNGIGWMRNLLDSKVFVFVGTISYSLYVWHLGIIWVLIKLNLPYGVKTYGCLIFSLIIASLSYHFIEKPVLQWSYKQRKKFFA